MFDVVRHRTAAVTSWTRRHRYRCGVSLGRWTRAWRYGVGRLSADDAQRLMLDCRYPAGWHPLLVLTVEDTLEQAREEIADHPDLPRLVADGRARRRQMGTLLRRAVGSAMLGDQPRQELRRRRGHHIRSAQR
jgi:hypothetical protein